MKISINSKDYNCPTGCSLAEAIQTAQIELGRRVAIAVNKRVVRKVDYETLILNDGDEVMIVNPCYGG